MLNLKPQLSIGVRSPKNAVTILIDNKQGASLDSSFNSRFKTVINKGPSEIDIKNQLNFRKIDNADNIPVRYKLKTKLKKMQQLNYKDIDLKKLTNKT
jgi:hypothetical protein